MIRKPMICQDDGGWIYMDIYRDTRMCLSVIIGTRSKNGFATINTYADLEDLSAAEMRDLWRELKKTYISPPVIMERIREDVITHLRHAHRVDLVAVCLDSTTYGEAALRL